MMTAAEMGDVVGVGAHVMREFIRRQGYEPVGFRRASKSGRNSFAFHHEPILAKFKQLENHKGRGRPRSAWQQLDLFTHYSASL